MVNPATQKLLITRAHVDALRHGCTFSDLVENRLIEYVSAEEEEYCMIGMDLKTMKASIASRSCTTYTHCEIHPSMILGVCASPTTTSRHVTPTSRPWASRPWEST